jgi:hypothetical protein
MSTVTGKPAVGNWKLPDIATPPVPDTFASLHVDPDHRADARQRDARSRPGFQDRSRLLNRGDAL